MDMPAIGALVRVTTDWSDYKKPFAQTVPRVYVTVGRVVEREPWEKDTVFGLHTANRKFPVSSVDISRVTQLEVLEEGFVQAVQPQEPHLAHKENATFIVKGSKGNSYVVTRERNSYSCDCPAGSRGRRCKHVLGVMREEQSA